MNIEEVKEPNQRIKRVRDIVGGFGADLVMDCSGHPSAGPEGIEMLRDGGTYVEMGQFTDAGSIATSWHRICAKDLNVLGSWGFTANDLPLGVAMLDRARDRYPWLDMQTLYPFDEDGVSRAVKDAMAMKTVKSTIVPGRSSCDPGRTPSARPRERVPIGACIYLAVGDNDVWPSTTILSKSMSIFPSTIGSRGNISEGGYHGCFSTTPFWTAFATNFPISSPSKGTSFLSLSYL